jgi:hypothetical protein
MIGLFEYNDIENNHLSENIEKKTYVQKRKKNDSIENSRQWQIFSMMHFQMKDAIVKWKKYTFVISQGKIC